MGEVNWQNGGGAARGHLAQVEMPLHSSKATLDSTCVSMSACSLCRVISYVVSVVLGLFWHLLKSFSMPLFLAEERNAKSLPVSVPEVERICSPRNPQGLGHHDPESPTEASISRSGNQNVQQECSTCCSLPVGVDFGSISICQGLFSSVTFSKPSFLLWASSCGAVLYVPLLCCPKTCTRVSF